MSGLYIVVLFLLFGVFCYVMIGKGWSMFVDNHKALKKYKIKKSGVVYEKKEEPSAEWE